MKNLWIQTEHAFATWTADFDKDASAPAKLLDTLRSTLISGEAHGVFVPRSVPGLGYRQGASGTLSDLLDRRWQNERILDLADFSDSAAEVAASLCLYDRDDQLSQRFVTDLGAELRALEPTPDVIPLGFTKKFAPVKLFGPRLSATPCALPTSLRISLHSDIWFPYVHGGAHPHADFVRYFDNRELAQCHTPRLNSFLSEVAATVSKLNGTWRLVEEDAALSLRPWMSHGGIAVDGPVPSLMPPEALSAEWY